MGDKLSGNRLGLTLGIFMAVIHILWSIFVALGIAERLINFSLATHFINFGISIASFDLTRAFLLAVIAFVAGYIFGQVIAGIWNSLKKS